MTNEYTLTTKMITQFKDAMYTYWMSMGCSEAHAKDNAEIQLKQLLYTSYVSAALKHRDRTRGTGD